MSDISIALPWWWGAWFLAGDGLAVTTVILAGVVAALFLSRRFGRRRLSRWLLAMLALVATAWVAGASYWGFGLADRVQTAIYVARHHYRLDRPAVVAGIAVPAGSWVSIDEQRRPYQIETAPGAAVTIDGARWQGAIRLVAPDSRKAGRGIVQAATLAADAVIEGTPCRAGDAVEFSDDGEDLQHCTLARQSTAAAEVAAADGRMTTQDVACAAGHEIELGAVAPQRLERCLLAQTTRFGPIACAGGEPVELSGEGLDACTLASAQQVGPFALPAGAGVRFTQLRPRAIEIPQTAPPLSISGLDVPPGSTIALCDGTAQIDHLEIPQDRYVTIAGVKLTGRLNFDCGTFRWGTLFADAVMHGRALPRHALVSREDVFGR